jgi:hypothetical protein
MTALRDRLRTRWATHNVLKHRSGVKQIRHPIIGELTLGYEALELPADTWHLRLKVPPAQGRRCRR